MNRTKRVATEAVPAANQPAQHRVLSPEAQRALDEARQRRHDETIAPTSAREVNGRGGLEPVRFGDWEVKGLASDF